MSEEVKEVKEIEMFGIGNFVIGRTLYSFRGTTKRVEKNGKIEIVAIGDKVKVQNKTHIPILKKEAQRRKKVMEKTHSIIQSQTL